MSAKNSKLNLFFPAAMLSTLSILSMGSTPAFSKPVFCEIRENSAVTATVQAMTILNQKVLLGTVRTARAYITEKDGDNFVIEAFLPEYEARIYGQGAIHTPNDAVGASLWGRDMLLEIQCRAKKTR